MASKRTMGTGRVAVLGGGITGLTVAHLLNEKLVDVTCFEAGPRTGGLCQSETIDGFVVDRAGGHILFSKDREVMDFVLRVLGPVGVHTSRRQTFIYHDGRYVQYPFENGLADLSANDRFLALKDYVEAVFARRQGAQAPSNFHDWCLWRFGKGICELFMHPYNRKIWNVDLHELGTSWVHGRVPDAPLEDVLRSALGIRTEGYVHQSTFHYPLTGGFESLVDCVRALIPTSKVRVGTPCESLEKKGDGFLVNGEAFDRVVSTIPLQELGRVLKGIPHEVQQSFGALDHTSLMTIFIALKKTDVPQHSWLYFPHDSDGPQNRVTWLSNYSPKNAPPGCASIMAEVTYHRDPPGSDEKVALEVIAGLSRAGLFRTNEVLWHRTFHNRYAYILYRHGLESNLEVIRSHCRSIDLHVCGRFGNYSYFNSDMCIRSAMDLAHAMTS